ncbi:hypothetical protein Tco_0623064 [Tanacetum coccineum]
MQLMQAQENEVVLDEEQLLFIAGGQTNTFDDDVDEAPVQDLALNEDNTFYLRAKFAFMMLINDMHEHAAQCVFANEQNKVVKESLTAELARYKEQVEVNEERERFELTEREQKINEQMRIIITNQHFEGIQMALVKEVKEMKEIFEQMEAEVDQNVVDKKSVEIERKNLLIENENLIADCLSNELLYSVMNDV